MKQKYNIGEIVGRNNSLQILDLVRANGESSYKVKCLKCSKDPELHGLAEYFRPSYFISSGKLPCGCAKNPKWSKKQWEVILKRKAKENNEEFLDFVGNPEKVDQNSKLKLYCNVCGNIWESCSINNYMKNRACPACANVLRGLKRNTPSIEWISRFRATGLFPESQFSFERVTPTSREWKVYCTKCSPLVFESDRSNLVAGKIPCDCSIGGGFDVSKDGYFYILDVTILGLTFLKFGITHFPSRRIKQHARILKEVGGIITNPRIFKGEGRLVFDIESNLKRTLQIENKFLEGFRREACSLDCLPEIEKHLESLTQVTETLTI